MALPDGFLDTLRDRLTLSDIVGRKVTWDARKSNPSRGDFWAPCPFHQEKTPSFHVDNRKGFYYCFGCHQKGNAFTFVQETERVGFMEAVEILAREAGMEMPRQTRDAKTVARENRQTRLYKLMEQATELFRTALRAGMGQAARDYARERGLADGLLDRFEIGFAPDSRNHLSTFFRDRGMLDDAIAAGLVIAPEDGAAPYDRFRNRLMFPIRDPRGRCIAFGGRALSPQARAKYLNSPETELFHKGRMLYNFAPARQAAAQSAQLIVAEGYMDVIALCGAGFDHSLAPLGTAITQDQLGMIWRAHDEPIIALDGDAAGLRAASRLIDLALPMLAPGRSLRFCLLPDGQDPDDVIRTRGPKAMAELLDDAMPLVEMLWRRESSAESLDTPERRAAFDQRLKNTLARIADPVVRDHYRADLRARRAALLRPQATYSGQRPPRSGPERSRQNRHLAGGPAMETQGSNLAKMRSDAQANARIREAAILLIALHNPRAAATLETELEAMRCLTPEFSRIRDIMLDAIAEETDPIAHMIPVLGQDPREILGRISQASAHPMAQPGCPAERAAIVLREAIGRHEAACAWHDEIKSASQDLRETDSENWTMRMRMIHEEQLRANIDSLTKLEDCADTKESEIQKLLDNLQNPAKKES